MIKHYKYAVVFFLTFSSHIFASSAEEDTNTLKRTERSNSFVEVDGVPEKSRKSKSVTFNSIRQVIYFSNDLICRVGTGFEYAYGSSDKSRRVEYLHEDESLKIDPAYMNIRVNKLLQAENSENVRKKFEIDRQIDIQSCESFQNYCMAFKEYFDMALANAENNLQALTATELSELSECYVKAANACLSYDEDNAEAVRALYLDMLMKRATFLTDLIKVNSERFHHAYSLLSDSLQNLIHEEQFKLAWTIIDEIHPIIKERMRLAHEYQDKTQGIKKNERCDGSRCEEFLRDLDEKNNILMNIKAANEQGRDYRDFLSEKFIGQTKNDGKE